MQSNADSDCEICHGKGFVPVDPNEDPPHTFRECICRRRAIQQRRLDQLMAQTGLTAAQLQKWSFDTFSPQDALTDAAGKAQLAHIKDACQAYAADPKGWLLLCGAYGCGKTHLAYAIIGAAYRAQRSVYACSVPDLLDTLRQGIDSPDRNDNLAQRFDAVRKSNVLLLDDLGAENLTPWAAEKLYQIIDYRYRLYLPLVVTTNVNVYDAKNRIEPRVLSRLLDGANSPDGWSRVFLISAQDYRQRSPRRP